MKFMRRLLSWLRHFFFGSQPLPERQVRITQQNVYTMVNNICLSTDMSILYLIDDGRAINFPLDQRNGILIGTLRGQLTATTAFEMPRPLKKEIEEADLGVSPSEGGPRLVLSASNDRKQLRLSTFKTVWTTVFHKERLTLSLIGATEVEIRSSEEEVDYKSEIVSFDLSEFVLNVRRIGDSLLIQALPRQEEG